MRNVIRRTVGTAAVCAAGVALPLAGCGEKTGGGAQSATATSEAPSTTTTPAGPSTVTTGQLPGLLLKRSELAAVLGADDLEQLETFDQTRVVGGIRVEPFSCTGAVVPGGIPMVMKDSAAVRGNVHSAANGQAVTQMVALQQSPVDANTLLAKVAKTLPIGCEVDTAVTMTLGAGTRDEQQQEWMMGPIVGGVNPSRVEISYSRASGELRSCRRILQAHGNVVVEADVCGAGDNAGQAEAVVEGIIDNIDGR